MGFSESLRKIRIEKGLSQKQLADKIGISQTAVYHYEIGDRKPKFATLDKIAQVLEISPISLIDVEDQGLTKEFLSCYEFSSVLLSYSSILSLRDEKKRLEEMLFFNETALGNISPEGAEKKTI